MTELTLIKEVRKLRLKITSILQLTILSCFLVSCASLPQISPPVGHTSHIKVTTKNGPIKIFVRDEGHGDPILLLHGFGANIFTWRYIYPDLSKKYRVIAIDMKGFGESDKPNDKEYSAFDQAKIVLNLIKKLKLNNVTLVGHSFGGSVALATVLTAKTKKRIKRLIIMDGLAYEQPIPFFLKVIRTPIISDLGMAIVPPEVHARASLSYSYQNQSRITDEAISNYAKPYYSLDSMRAARQTAKQLVPKDLSNYTRLYHKIKMPTLLIWCRHDRVIPLINGFKLHSNLPNSSLEVIGDCGHIPHEEAPTETVNSILSFLKEKS